MGQASGAILFQTPMPSKTRRDPSAIAELRPKLDLREDLVKGLKIGDRFEMRVPALGDKLITAAIRRIATRGEYAGWPATRATGDFDLRTFEIRAYPVEPLPELRPGMSVYADWKRRP